MKRKKKYNDKTRGSSLSVNTNIRLCRAKKKTKILPERSNKIFSVGMNLYDRAVKDKKNNILI
jgi:hypothetical protein